MLSRWLQSSSLPPRRGAKPVTLLTGFLGSGKTTLLNEMLADPRMKDAAVIVNEFGDVAVDHDLIKIGRESYLVTSTGCLCCTASSDIRTSLFELSEASRRGLAPSFNRVVIETTGLADPTPIVNSLLPGGTAARAFRDHAVAREFNLTNVISTLDAFEGEAALDRYIECWKQLVFADRIVLTKTDLRGDGKWYWTDLLGQMGLPTPLVDKRDPDFDPVSLIKSGSYQPSERPEDVIGWLAMDRLAALPHSHDHDPNRHGTIRSLSLIQEYPLDAATILGFLNVLTGPGLAGILRIKGLLCLDDDPTRPLVVHAVGHKLYPPARLDNWPSEDTRSRLVVIGEDLPEQKIRKLFDVVVPRDARRRISAA